MSAVLLTRMTANRRLPTMTGRSKIWTSDRFGARCLIHSTIPSDFIDKGSIERRLRAYYSISPSFCSTSSQGDPRTSKVTLFTCITSGTCKIKLTRATRSQIQTIQSTVLTNAHHRPPELMGYTSPLKYLSGWRAAHDHLPASNIYGTTRRMAATCDLWMATL